MTMIIVEYIIWVVILLAAFYLGLGIYIGKLYYQEYKPKNRMVSKTEKAKLILYTVGLAFAWGPLLLWIIIDDKIKGNHIWI